MAKSNLRRKILIPGIVFLALLYLALEFLHGYNVSESPDKSRYDADSYGTFGHGYHGAHAVLTNLNVETGRSIFPPPDSLDPGDTLLILDFTRSILQSWQAPLKESVEWVKSSGGHMVIAGSLPISSRMQSSRITEILNIPGLRSSALDLAPETTVPVTFNTGWISRMYYPEKAVYGTVSLVKTGSFAEVPGLDQLCLMVDAFPCFDLSKVDLPVSSTIQLVQEGKTTCTVAVQFPLGSGTITLVSAPSLFSNALLRYADNSVLLAAVTSQGSGRVVFDEFYHGHMVRSSAFLLGRPGYALMLTAALLAIGLWVWRASFRLGPPMPERIIQRRTITEYLDGIGNLFVRKKKFNFLLKELYDGALWSLRREYHPPPEREQFDDLIAAMARRDSERADHTQQILNRTRALLNERRVTENQFTTAAKELTTCL